MSRVQGSPVWEEGVWPEAPGPRPRACSVADTVSDLLPSGGKRLPCNPDHVISRKRTSLLPENRNLGWEL